MRRMHVLRAAVILLVLAVFIAPLSGCKDGEVTLNSVTKKYQAVQKSYEAVQQAVRQAYLSDLIDDKLYKEFVDEVDARAVKADALIRKTLEEAKRLEGVNRADKLSYAIELIVSFNNIVSEAGRYAK
jgi:hypothetical protein